MLRNSPVIFSCLFSLKTLSEAKILPKNLLKTLLKNLNQLLIIYKAFSSGLSSKYFSKIILLKGCFRWDLLDEMCFENLCFLLKSSINLKKLAFCFGPSMRLFIISVKIKGRALLNNLFLKPIR